MVINKQDTNGTKALLQVGEFGYDNFSAGGDVGRVYVGNGSANIAMAKKAEVTTVDGKVETHTARVDNPHSVTKTQVGLGNVQDVDTTNASNITSGTLANARLANSGVTAGTYKSVTVDGKGIVTSGTNPTTLSGYGITDAVAKVTSTDNAIVRFDGTTGAVQNSGVIIDDNGNLNLGSGLNYGGMLSINVPQTSSYAKYLTLRDASGGTLLDFSTYADPSYSTSNIINFTGAYLAIRQSGAERMRIDSAGNVLVTGTGGLGYGTGSGGTVTQLTSKTTAVTLNKPSGQIITSNSSLGAGVTTAFILNNSLLTGNDNVKVIVGDAGAFGAYQADCTYCVNGAANITIKNLDLVSRTDAVTINFTIIKGATS